VMGLMIKVPLYGYCLSAAELVLPSKPQCLFFKP